MSDVLVPTIVDTPMDFTVIATSPKDMEAGQRSLILWAARKIQMVKNEIEEARAQLKLAHENKWNTAGWRSQILKQERRAEFYRKIKAALEAGYYIVPPFPIDIFAIRTDRRRPHRYDSSHSNNHDQPAKALAIGAGRYVDPRPVRDWNEHQEKRGDKMVTVTNYYATEYQDVDFPFKLAKAEVRAATDRAMKAMIFDRLGVLPRKRSPDPIVVGEIIVPNQPAYRMGRHGTPQVVSFFVAWWLDTKTL